MLDETTLGCCPLRRAAVSFVFFHQILVASRFSALSTSEEEQRGLIKDLKRHARKSDTVP